MDVHAEGAHGNRAGQCAERLFFGIGHSWLLLDREDSD
jgi:hypothetical protein